MDLSSPISSAHLGGVPLAMLVHKGEDAVADEDGAHIRVCVVEPADLDDAEVRALYDAVGWSVYTRAPRTLRAALAGSHRVVVARDGKDALVGMARAISDGATICYVQDVLVHPDRQRSGVGRRLLQRLLAEYAGVRQQVLLTDTEPGQHAFYRSLGFTESHDTDPAVRAFVRFDS